MKNALTVFRRDFGAFFTSPIGYIFMIVFLLISVGLYITSFFTFPVADMRSYFSNLPILLCVFIPAVTMRVWAEERKENTWEMLLTFPMKARELVLGKFLAVLAFFALTLFATITVPIMLAALGDPDGGAIFGGYLGTLLLGAFFLSIGIFISGLCKDQIVAFVVTLLACFAIFLVGTNFIASYVDGVFPGMGSRLSQYLGFLEHYNSFVRGVIELADVVYFVAWTAIFLGLNMMFIEGRHRPKAKATFAGAIVLCLAIGLLFNGLVYGQSIGRYDATEGKIYTISPASKAILGDLKQPVQVTLYVTPKGKMPTGLKTLEQDITDKLDELAIASAGNVKYKTIHLEAANVQPGEEDSPFLGEDESANPDKAKDKDKDKPKDEKKAIENRMLEKGIRPFPVQAIDDDQVTSQLIYSSLGVAFGNKKEEIIAPVVPQNLPELEYRLVSTIHKLTREKMPVIALVAPEESVNIPPQMRAIYQQMGQPIPQSEDPYELAQQWLTQEKYEVRRVKLTQESPLPDDFDALVVLDPRNMNDRQRWEINRVLVSGKPVVLAVQNYQWQYDSAPDGRPIHTKQDNSPNVNELLDQYGFSVDKDVLMDKNSFPLNIQSRDSLAQLLGMGQSLALPIHIQLDTASMNPNVAITSRLSTVLYLWGTALKFNDEEMKKHSLKHEVLMSTSPEAWTVPADTPVQGNFYEAPESGLKKYPVMAMITGQFPDVYKDKPRPEWEAEPTQPGMPPQPPKEDGEAKPVTPKPGKLLLLGGSEMFKKSFLQAGGDLDLLLNTVDAVSLDERLVAVRGLKPIDRTIAKPEAGTRTMWKIVNYALGSVIIAAVGITAAAVRRNRRNAYTMAYLGE